MCGLLARAKTPITDEKTATLMEEKQLSMLWHTV
jgi:hypothetical protein